MTRISTKAAARITGQTPAVFRRWADRQKAKLRANPDPLGDNRAPLWDQEAVEAAWNNRARRDRN